MRYLISSDHHFGHSNLCKPEYESRPLDFNERILENTKTAIAKAITTDPDLTYITLGDMCFGGNGPKYYREFLDIFKNARSSGNVSLVGITGNHDNNKQAAYLSAPEYSVVGSVFVFNLNGKALVLTHEPIDVSFVAAIPRSGNSPVNIHGHLHTAGHRADHKSPVYLKGYQILIAQEFMDYRPISLDELVTLGRTPKWNGERFVSLYDAMQ